MKAPDITSTETGKQIVNIMAKGVLRYMQEHQIPITKAGYDTVVEDSKSSGLNGKIAFLDPESKRAIIELLSKTTGAALQLFEFDKKPTGRQKPSIRQRLHNWHLLPNDNTLDPDTKEAYLSRLKQEVGEESVPFLEAVRHGDCQRRLVWDRIQELHQESK